MISAGVGLAQIGDSLSAEEAMKTYTPLDLNYLSNSNPMNISVRPIDLSYEGVKGTAYLQAEFEPGIIRLRNGSEVVESQADVQLDIHNHELWVKLPQSEQVLIISPEQLISVVFLNEKQEFRPYLQEVLGERAEPFTYAQIMHEGKNTLLKVYDKTFRKADFSGSYGSTGARYDEFVLYNRYYLSVGDGPFEKIRINRKRLQKALPDAQAAVKAWFKKGHSMETEEDLLNLILYLE
jgi:hypothetical protein